VFIPVYVKSDISPNTVKQLQMAFTELRGVTTPTQYEGGKDSAKGKSAAKKKQETRKPWTLSVPIIPYDKDTGEGKRDKLICDTFNELYNMGLDVMVDPLLWKTMDKEEVRYPNRDVAASHFKSPLSDAGFGGESSLRVKYNYNGFTNQKQFYLWDMRTKREDKDYKETSPDNIKEGDMWAGSFTIADLWIRTVGDTREPSPTWGFTCTALCTRLEKGDADSSAPTSFKNLGEWSEDEEDDKDEDPDKKSKKNPYIDDEAEEGSDEEEEEEEE
jgi:hypothetical protein